MEKIDARQNENKVEFLKKKNSRKNEYDIQEKKKKEKEEEDTDTDTEKKRKRLQTTQYSSNIQQQYSEGLSNFFEEKKFRINTSGNIRIGSVSVNKKDLIYDLTHQAVKDSSFNLSSDERYDVLRELKRTGMPASNIRNTTLKKIYITGKKNFGERSFTTSDDDDDLGGIGSSLLKKKKSSLDYDRVLGRGRK